MEIKTQQEADRVRWDILDLKRKMEELEKPLKKYNEETYLENQRKMTTYLVTLELKTPFWWKVLRFFRIKNKREEFYITIIGAPFEKDAILETGGSKMKVIQQISR